MFSHVLKQLPLTDTVANDFFTNIYADSFEGDDSFCANLRALLYRRLNENESITVKLDINTVHDEMKGLFNIRKGSLCCTLPIPNDYMYIRVFKGFSAKEIETTLSNTSHALMSFTLLEDVSLYLSQFGIRSFVYINEERRQTILIMTDINQKIWHKMQSALPRLMPWHFMVPMQSDESQLLHSLTRKDSSGYLIFIQEFANKFNFREDRLRKLLKDFVLKSDKQRHETLLVERVRNTERFSRLQQDIADCIGKEKQLLSDIACIEFSLQQGDRTGLEDYFKYNKSLHLVSVGIEELTYVVTTYLEYFDQKIFEKCLNNPSSYFYKSGSEQSKQELKRLLEALYGDEACIRVRTCAAFNMSLSGSLSPITNSNILPKYKNWLPNAHLDGYACLGTNTTHINQLMHSQKYIEAIEQSIASTKNINFADSAIAPKFIDQLRNGSQKFLELPSGDVVSPEEAIEWLSREEI